MRMPFTSRLIFSFIGLSLPIAAHAEDMNETHIFNQAWPPHAKFHDGQTLALSLLLGGTTLFFAWKPSRNVPAMVTAAGLAANTYFVTQGAAILYPGTDYFDPGVPKRTILGVPAPVAIVSAYLAAAAVASWVGLRRPTLQQRLAP